MSRLRRAVSAMLSPLLRGEMVVSIFIVSISCQPLESSTIGQSDVADSDRPAHHQADNIASTVLNHFTENRGQWDPQALYRATTPGGMVWISSEGVAYQILRPVDRNELQNLNEDLHPESAGAPPDQHRPISSWTIKAQFIGCKAEAPVSGLTPLASTTNYFLGSDRVKWQTGVNSYTAIKWTELYPNIDLVYYSNGGELEYDFVVHPSGNFDEINIRYDGVESILIHPDGHLELKTPLGTVTEHKPFIYQFAGSKRIQIVGRYVMKADSSIAFKLDQPFDNQTDLIIDPQLSFSTYLSGSQDEFIFDVQPTSDGNLLVSGALTSSDFPLTAGYDSTYNGAEDHIIAKLSPTTKSFLFSTYVGGGSRETGGWVAPAGDNTIWFAGVTQSADYPMVNARDNSFGGGEDIILARFSADCDSLLYSTFIGVSDTDRVSGIALTSKGEVCLPGLTYSTDFPTAGTPYQPTIGGGLYDGILLLLDSSGQNLIYSTFLGGVNTDICRAVAVDSADNLFVTGGTKSAGFPATAGVYDDSYNGTGANYDVFVTKFAPSGASLLWSTFVGGTGDDFAYDIDIDHSGRPCIVGHAHTGFPVTGASTANGLYEAFAARLSANGSALEFSRLLSGSSDDIGRSGAVDNQNRFYVAGNSRSTNFPTTTDAFQGTNHGGYDPFVTVLDPDQDSILHSTYLGGASGDTQRGFAIAKANNRDLVYLTGYTTSTDFPMAGAIDSTANAGGFLDGFVSRLTISWCCKGTAGNVNGIGIVDLSDLSSLVSYLTGGGFVSPCSDEANVNATGIVDLSDLSALVSFLTGGGFVLPNCP